MLAAMTAGSLMTRLRKLAIAVLAGATVLWLVQVVAPVADIWLGRTAEQLKDARLSSYFEQRDPVACADLELLKEDCVRRAIQAQRDWAATKRAVWQAAWDLDLLVWSTLLNVAVGLTPLLLVVMNRRRATAEPLKTELY